MKKKKGVGGKKSEDESKDENVGDEVSEINQGGDEGNPTEEVGDEKEESTELVQ